MIICFYQAFLPPDYCMLVIVIMIFRLELLFDWSSRSSSTKAGEGKLWMPISS